MRGPDVSEHRQHQGQFLADVVGRVERELAASGSVSVQSLRRIVELIDRFCRFVEVGHRFPAPLDEYSWKTTSMPLSEQAGVYDVRVVVNWPTGSYTLRTYEYRTPRLWTRR